MSNTDRLANVAVIVMCMTLSGAAIWTVFSNRSSGAQRGNPYQVGELTDFKDAGFESSERTLLLVVSSSCQTCTRSLPFYRTAIETASASRKQNAAPRARIVVVALDPPDVGKKYLDDNDVKPDALIRMPSSAWQRIRGTPTILLVDSKGTVLDTWVGLLSSEEEKQVLRKLTGAA
jgi:hypothetical protein